MLSVDAVLHRVERVLCATPNRSSAVILVDGRSGSGKSSLASRIVAASDSPVQLVRLDDLYPGWDGLAAGSGHILDNVLAPLADGRPASWQRWDWTEDAPAEWHEVDPNLPLVIEGAGALTSRNRALATLGIWVELSDAIRKERALARDGEPYARQWDRWAAQEESFAEREDPRSRADVEVSGQFIIRETIIEPSRREPR